MSKAKTNTKHPKSSDQKYRSADGRLYLDKRTVVRNAQSAGRDAAVRAKASMGYAVVAERGWIVKQYSDGRQERVERIHSSKK